MSSHGARPWACQWRSLEIEFCRADDLLDVVILRLHIKFPTSNMNKFLLGILLLAFLSSAEAATCPKGQKATWSGGQKVCEPFTLPENATLDYSGNGWACKKGFRRTGYGPTAICEKIVPPENARLNTYGNDWECLRGFRRNGYGPSAKCDPVVIPENARLNTHGNDFDCDRGFRRARTGTAATCEKVEIPANAKLNPYGNDWACNRGFVRKGYGPTAECKAVIVPANAKLNYAGDGWECARNHVQRKDACIHASQADDGEIRKLVIGESIAGYPGNCPCPYFADRAGRSCGRRSAYSRASGYSPLCYPNDVSDQMVANYRKGLTKN